MGQVTIYLEDEIEKKMKIAVDSSHLSKSKWIANIIKEKVTDEWPESISALSGAWKDIPTVEEMRLANGTDVKREDF